jgi:hypothetical protein
MSWEQLAPQTVQRLSNDLNISPQVATGIVGQLGYESAGLQSINEMQPVVPGSRGGYGWAQWTGPRRRQFESWAQQNNMDVADPEANYQFLVYELTQTPEKGVLNKLQGVQDPVQAGKIFTDSYLRPGVPAYDKRASWVEKTINALVPAAQAQTQQGGNVAQQASPYSLEQLQTGLQRAQEAGNQEAVQELQQLISAQQPQARQQPDTSTTQQQVSGYSMEQLQTGLQQAQAAGNQEAVQEIQGLMSQASSPQNQPTTQTPPQEAGLMDQMKRAGGLFLRSAGEGAEQAFTFPVRAVGEAVATGANLVGFPQASKSISETVGMSAPTIASGVSDVAGLPKPQTGLEKGVAGGVKAMAGAGVGGVANTLARNAPQLSQQALANVMPVATTGKQLGLFGGVGSAMEAAPLETSAGLATLATLAAASAARKGKANLNVRSAEKGILQAANQSPSRAATDSEIILKINEEFNDPNRMVKGKIQPLTAMELNNVQDSFTNTIKASIEKLPQNYPNKKLYLDSLKQASGLDSAAINNLRDDPMGVAVADAIEQAQRARALTEAVGARGGLAGAAARAGTDAAPIAISAGTGVPAYIPQGLTASIKNKLGGRINRDARGQKLVGESMVQGAQNVLKKTGASEASQGKEVIDKLVDQAVKSQAALKAAQEAQKAARAAARQVSPEEAARRTAERAAKKAADLEAKSQAELKQGLADVQAKDPTYLLGASNEFGAPRNPTEMTEFSNQIKRQMEAREALNAVAPVDPVQAALQKSLADVKAKDPTYLLELSNKIGTPRNEKEMKTFSKLMKRDLQKRYGKEGVAELEPIEVVAVVKKNSLDNWSQGKTGSGGVQGTMTEYTGLKDKDLVSVLDELSQRKPDFAPFIQNIRESSKVPSTQVLGMIQDEAVRIATEQGLKVSPKILKKAAKEAGVKGTGGIADEFYKRASQVVSGLNDEALTSIINRTKSASGKDIKARRAYTTGAIAKILNDKAQGREIDDVAAQILEKLGL